MPVKPPLPTNKAPASPLPVEVANEEPLQVAVAQATPPAPIKTPDGKLSLPPNTTEADDKVTAGQRHINRIWEYSQSFIALSITLAIIYCAINEITSQELSNGFFLIIGFYFGRANHQNQGGVGAKPQEGVYIGR